MSFSLIVPIAGDRPEYAAKLPHVFEKSKNGLFLCVEAIKGLNLDVFNSVYYVLLQKLEDKYMLKDELCQQITSLGLKDVHVVLLQEPTISQPETIYRTISQCRISGSIFIKDPDGYFKGEIIAINGITTYPLEKMSLVDPQNKSYVAVDDMFCVTNIIEKRVISNLFNAGGYVFEDSKQFCEYYDMLKHHGVLFLSHIIYAMLLDNIIFRPIAVSNYEDWGTRWLYKLKTMND